MAACFTEQGHPLGVATLMAWGTVAKLLDRAFESVDDCLGTVLEAEMTAGWVGDVGRLTRALNQAGFVRIIDNNVYLVEVINAMTETVKKRFQRMGRMQGAAARAAHWEPTKTGAVEEVGLFGQTTKEAPHDKTEHAKLVEYWATLWSGAHGGKKYPFRPKDAAAITAIRRFAGSYTDACNVLESYVSERGDYFSGHDLQKCVQQLGRFIAKSQPRAARKGEFHRAGPRPAVAIDAATEAGAAAFERRIARLEGKRGQDNGVVGGGGVP